MINLLSHLEFFSFLKPIHRWKRAFYLSVQTLEAELYRNIKAFIDVVGLDRVLGDADFSDKDDRWDERLASYDLATRYYQKYTNNPSMTDSENTVDLAAGIGFFSVWYEVSGLIMLYWML